MRTEAGVAARAPEAPLARKKMPEGRRAANPFFPETYALSEAQRADFLKNFLIFMYKMDPEMVILS
jgi:hypothetical protein